MPVTLRVRPCSIRSHWSPIRWPQGLDDSESVDWLRGHQDEHRRCSIAAPSSTSTAVRAWWTTRIWRAPTPTSTRASKSDVDGLRKVFRQFSFPGGIPSHVAAETPGSIHEGGELSYAQVHAYGAAFDNPDVVVACVIGDGEAEPAATSVTGHSLGLDYRRPISGDWGQERSTSAAADTGPPRRGSSS